MPKGYTYILECSDGSYYTGSTVDMEKRLNKHQNGQGVNHTKKRLPVKLVYLEEHQRIDDAFYREKQIQGWSRAKKEALIQNNLKELNKLSECKNDSHYALWLRLRSATEERLRSATEERLTSNTRKDQRSHTPKSQSTNKEETLMSHKKTYKSNGKLLLTAEYAVLDGAKALAIPTKYGQRLVVEANDSDFIRWKSYNELDAIWFECRITYDEIATTDGKSPTLNDVKIRLIQILRATKSLNPEFLGDEQGYAITTHQDFNRLWGLGTSSTLINNIADWASVDAYQLLEKTFGGSGYDIACAQNDHPISFQLQQLQKPLVESVDFQPDFKQHLYFVYLNQKQNSRDGISAYKKLGKVNSDIINQINSITEAMMVCKSLSEFKSLIETHETMISKLIQQKPIKTRLFPDFQGAVKSLGAWGGDFVLVASEENPTAYFKAKGFDTVISYKDMVLV